MVLDLSLSEQEEYARLVTEAKAAVDHQEAREIRGS